MCPTTFLDASAPGIPSWAEGLTELTTNGQCEDYVEMLEYDEWFSRGDLWSSPKNNQKNKTINHHSFSGISFFLVYLFCPYFTKTMM